MLGSLVHPVGLEPLDLIDLIGKHELRTGKNTPGKSDWYELQPYEKKNGKYPRKRIYDINLSIMFVSF